MWWWCFFFFLLSLLQTGFFYSPSLPSQLCLRDERSALLQLKHKHYHVSLPYYNYHVPLNSWNPNTDCCFWEGITCDGTSGHVVGLDLFNSSLFDSIHSNSTLFHLHHLQLLNLSSNSFDYFVPSGFDMLSRLMHLNLSYNYFSGPIPSQLSQLIDLVSLDLSSNRFGGQIPSQISKLTKLVSLDLSWNQFGGQIPSQISKLTKLVSLDLSWNQFGGQIPSQISKLTKLVSLDLSSNYEDSKLEIPNLGAFVQNLSNLRELRLDNVNLSAPKNRDWCRRLSSALPNLQVLSMSECSLTGPLDASISSLRFLSELYLDNNYNLYSTVPTSLMNLTSLTVLSLDDCGFHGDFPINVFLQPNLKYISITENPLLSGYLPEFRQGNNTALQFLDIGGTKFQGKLLSSIVNLKFLKVLGIGDLNMSGPIPPFLANFTHLTMLDLSSNSFIGQIPSFFRGSFPDLEALSLEDNLLQGPIHSYLFFLPSLTYLNLSNNQFSGVINEPIHNISSSFPVRHFFSLGGNYLEGQELMRSISKINGTFEILDLSFNDFSYMVEDDAGLSSNDSDDDNFVNAQIQYLVMSFCNISKFPDFLRNQKKLRELTFSGNRISKFPEFLRDQKKLSYLDLSVNRISKFPDFLRDLKALQYLFISGNRIDGAIPKWIWQKNLVLVNMSNNLFTGLELPLLPNHSFNIGVLDLHSNMIQDRSLSKAPCSLQTPNQSTTDFVSPILGNLTFLLSEASFFSISDNKLAGKIPHSICNASNLGILDLSNNQLSGTIPTCLGSSNLRVLNLESNKLHGPIPLPFKNGCKLHTLKLNKNMLQGKVPRSLDNCKELTVFDVADNQLNDTFPHWLENLSELQVLVMRSNRFGGPIVQLPRLDSPFQTLHVIDISFNNFVGILPLQYICQWKAMMFDVDTSELNYSGPSGYSTYYQDTLVVMEKGLQLKMQRILTTFATVDLSNNNFEGKIPDALGILKALKALNLSGNSLIGRIPFSLGNLTELESLDLSRNKLSGEIPRQLISMTSLEVLNISYNNFIGSIPQGNQFNTFSNTSYEENAGLCGFPLSRKCGALHPTSVFQQEEDDSTCLFDWKFALAGYCSGLIIGLVIGQQLFWRINRCSMFIYVHLKSCGIQP